MSPILVRPFREQYEHDRVIRLLQTRFRRRFDVRVNVADEQTATVRYGSAVLSPDLVLSSPGRKREIQAVVEVETAESVNHLEAMAQWARFAKLRNAFYLYVPVGCADVARRLCLEHQIGVTETWSYHSVGNRLRFTLIQRASPVAPPRRGAKSQRKRPSPTARRKPTAPRRSTRSKPKGRGERSRAGRARKK